MKLSVLTLFPDSLTSMLDASILGRARKGGKLTVDAIDMRAFSTNKHHTVDDSPTGGGAGMVLRVDIVAGALKSVEGAHTILVDARGKLFTHADAKRLAALEHVAIVCGRYEGIDARAFDLVDEVVSLGDYVLTGGELAALAIIDATARLLPGVLKNEASSAYESHSDVLLEHRHYTRPTIFLGQAIPPVLLAGNHRDIKDARRKDALIVTARVRPDLLVRARLTARDDELLANASVPTLEPVRQP